MARTDPDHRERGEIESSYSIVVEIRHILRGMGIRGGQYTISSNVRHMSRFPRSPRRAERDDPGAALYFTKREWTSSGVSATDYCIPCDVFDTAADNLMSILKALELLQDMKSECGVQLYRQAMSSFRIVDRQPRQNERHSNHEAAAQDEPNESEAPGREEEPPGDRPEERIGLDHLKSEPWFIVLGFERPPLDVSVCERSYRQLIKQYHPDVGGRESDASIINDAIWHARKYFGQDSQNI